MSSATTWGILSQWAVASLVFVAVRFDLETAGLRTRLWSGPAGGTMVSLRSWDQGL